jgi:hypothetical protein
MNVQLLKRAIDRQVYMRDRPVYAELLQHIDLKGDVWKVPQNEVADWWEKRQACALEIEVAGGTLKVTSPLEESVVEVDGRELRVPPFQSTPSRRLEDGRVTLTYRYSGKYVYLVREVVCHLGYGHIVPAPDGAKADIPGEELEPHLEKLHETSVQGHFFSEDSLSAIRGIIDLAHHRAGLPSLRVWTLPHRSGRPYRSCVSVRFDVDKAICNLPSIHELEARHGLRSTVYLRPTGYFYGEREIRRYCAMSFGAEIALHGEFVSTATRLGGDEIDAARLEKKRLEEIAGREVVGVCMHGGELHENRTPRSREAIQQARFKYETLYRRLYFHPLHLSTGESVRPTLSVGEHYMDMYAPLDRSFSKHFRGALMDQFSRAEATGGILVPVFHPLYFDVFNYLRQPSNLVRFATFVPKYVHTAMRLRRGQIYVNQD